MVAVSPAADSRGGGFPNGTAPRRTSVDPPAPPSWYSPGPGAESRAADRDRPASRPVLGIVTPGARRGSADAREYSSSPCVSPGPGVAAPLRTASESAPPTLAWPVRGIVNPFFEAELLFPEEAFPDESPPGASSGQCAPGPGVASDAETPRSLVALGIVNPGRRFCFRVRSASSGSNSPGPGVSAARRSSKAPPRALVAPFPMRTGVRPSLPTPPVLRPDDSNAPGPGVGSAAPRTAASNAPPGASRVGARPMATALLASRRRRASAVAASGSYSPGAGTKRPDSAPGDGRRSPTIVGPADKRRSANEGAGSYSPGAGSAARRRASASERASSLVAMVYFGALFSACLLALGFAASYAPGPGPAPRRSLAFWRSHADLDRMIAPRLGPRAPAGPAFSNGFAVRYDPGPGRASALRLARSASRPRRAPIVIPRGRHSDESPSERVRGPPDWYSPGPGVGSVSRGRWSPNAPFHPNVYPLGAHKNSPPEFPPPKPPSASSPPGSLLGN